MAEITVPKEYGLVVMTTVATFFLSTWHSFKIGPVRKQTPMRIPKMVADSGDFAAAKTPEEKNLLHLFNRVQRAHQNYLENQPTAAMSLLIAGLAYPRLTSAMGVTWMVGRIMYALGYLKETEKPGSGRIPGFAVAALSQLFLFGLAGYSGWRMWA